MVGVSENIVNIAQAAVNIAFSLHVSIETEKTERPWPLLVTASVSGLLYSLMGIFNNISLRAIREGAYYMLFCNFVSIFHDQIQQMIFSEGLGPTYST